MNIKVFIDVKTLAVASSDPEVTITEITENSGVITLEVSKPDPVIQTTQPYQGI